MAPRKSQSADLISFSKTLDSSSKVSPIISDTLVTPAPDVSELPPLPIQPSASAIGKDIGKPPSNSTDISDALTKSGDGSDSVTAPVATEDPASPRTFSYNHDTAVPVNGTVIDDQGGDTLTSDASPSGGPRTAGSSPSDLAASVQTSSPSPPEDEGTNRAGNEDGLDPSATQNLTVSAANAAAPLFFSSASAFTSGSTVYVMSTYASTSQTTLPNGSMVTTAKGFTTQVPAPSAEANTDTGGSSDRPRQNPGPFIENTPSSETFFQRPAAAAGVFIVVLLIVGSFVWMFLIIRRHRRQIAAAAKERKRPSYLYGSTGISLRDRRSYMSYESHNWPQRFQRNSLNTAASASRPAPAPDSNAPIAIQSHASAVIDFKNSEIGMVFAPPGSSIPAHYPVLRSQSQRSILRTTSPPIPPRSPLRLWLPPARTSNAAPDAVYLGEYTNAIASGSNQHRPASSDFVLSRTPSNLPSRRRASSSTPFHYHPHPLTSTPSPVASHFLPNIGSTSRNSVDRQLGDQPLIVSAENLFRSSAYIVPSPTPSAELQGSNERLSNPFDDAESPPHSPIALTYVSDGGATQSVILERGVSLRRNDSLKNRPMHTQNLCLPQGPSTAEWGSSGSEAASSSIHMNVNASSKSPSGYRAMERRVARKSESTSTAETSAANSVHRLASLDEDELFYNPAFAVASPVRDNNPQFPDIRG